MTHWCVLIENEAVWCPDTESQAKHLAWNIHDTTKLETQVEHKRYKTDRIERRIIYVASEDGQPAHG